jgi:hypothetical protein
VRLLSLLVFGFLAGLIVLTYNMKFETRRLEARAAELGRAIEDEKDNVALMRAEWSRVTAPERIEKLARDILPLQSVKSTQLIKQEEFTQIFSRKPVPVANAKKTDTIGNLISGKNGNKRNHTALRGGKGARKAPQNFDAIGALIQGKGQNVANTTTQ